MDCKGSAFAGVQGQSPCPFEPGEGNFLKEAGAERLDLGLGEAECGGVEGGREAEEGLGFVDDEVGEVGVVAVRGGEFFRGILKRAFRQQHECGRAHDCAVSL